MKKVVVILIVILLLSGTAAYAQPVFPDTDQNAWYYEELARAKELGIIEGCPDVLHHRPVFILFVFLDEIVAKYWIASNAKDFVVLEEGLSDEVYAIGFRKKDQALRDAVNETIKAMKADGKFNEISAKWFGK